MNKPLEEKPSNYLSTRKVAEMLGYTAVHIRDLCRLGKIKAHKIGHDWMIELKVAQKLSPKKTKPKAE